MDELDIDTYYGAFTMPVEYAHGAGELRIFSLGYIDHRTLTLKTDNRPAPVRTADTGKIELGTYGADYVHVFNTPTAGSLCRTDHGEHSRSARARLSAKWDGNRPRRFSSRGSAPDILTAVAMAIMPTAVTELSFKC